MNTVRNRRLLAASILLLALHAGIVTAADPAPVPREIIPGSELMTAQEREQYRVRLRGARSAEERERLRAEHVAAMEKRAQLRGLKVSDPTRERKGQAR